MDAVLDLWVIVYRLWLRANGLGWFGVYGLEFRVYGLGLMVEQAHLIPEYECGGPGEGETRHPCSSVILHDGHCTCLDFHTHDRAFPLFDEVRTGLLERVEMVEAHVEPRPLV